MHRIDIASVTEEENVGNAQPLFSLSLRNCNQSPLHRVMLFGYLHV
jgi:hypothetical protein